MRTDGDERWMGIELLFFAFLRMWWCYGRGLDSTWGQCHGIGVHGEGVNVVLDLYIRETLSSLGREERGGAGYLNSNT
jgi:hypothetical protein